MNMTTHTRLETASREELIQTIQALQAKLAYASYSQHFGCATRQGLELALEDIDLNGRTIIFWDIDGLKAYNARYGLPESNRRIGSALKARAGDVFFGQWYSGDEFAAFVPDADAAGFARRLQDGLHAIGISATFVIGHYRPGIPVLAQVDALTEHCGWLKSQDQRNCIDDLRRGQS